MTDGMRARHILLLAFFAYVVLDLGCPMIPGAFSFDPAQSVDAVSAYRARPEALPRVMSVPSSTPAVRLLAETSVPAGEDRAVPSPAAWRPHAGRDHAVAPDPRLSTEDD